MRLLGILLLGCTSAVGTSGNDALVDRPPVDDSTIEDSVADASNETGTPGDFDVPFDGSLTSGPDAAIDAASESGADERPDASADDRAMNFIDHGGEVFAGDAVEGDAPSDAPNLQDASPCLGGVDSITRGCTHCKFVDAIVVAACRPPLFDRCYQYSVDCIDPGFVHCMASRYAQYPGLREACVMFCNRARDAGYSGGCAF
ncbi:MAG: hypothetical protein JNK72_25370 [Myxococcales bacterium]|nr:hypothetical protein [Myxococcales bacterium]